MKKTEKREAQEAVKIKPETQDEAKQSSLKLSQPQMIGLGLVAVLLVAFGFLYNRYWPIAVVNGQAISRLEYYKALEVQVGKETIDRMVTEELIKQEAQKQGVTIEQAVIDAEMAKIEQQMAASGQSLDAALAVEGMTKNDLIEQIQLRQLVQLMGRGEASVSAEEIETFLKDNKALLPTDKKPEELRELAKSELIDQAQNDNIQGWLQSLKAGADIQYR